MSINGGTNDFVVNTTGADGQTSERLSRLVDGRMLEVWQSERLSATARAPTIRARIVATTGDPTGAAADFIVNTTATGEPVSSADPQLRGRAPADLLALVRDLGTDTIRGRFVHANGSLDPSDFVIASLADTSVADTHARAARQPASRVQLSGHRERRRRRQTESRARSGRPPTSTPQGRFTNTGASSFDIALQSFTTDQAAAQISRGNAPWNDALGTSHSFDLLLPRDRRGRELHQRRVRLHPVQRGRDRRGGSRDAALGGRRQHHADARAGSGQRSTPTAGQFLLWNYASATARLAGGQCLRFRRPRLQRGHLAAIRSSVSTTIARTSSRRPSTMTASGCLLHEIGHALGLSPSRQLQRSAGRSEPRLRRQRDLPRGHRPVHA